MHPNRAGGHHIISPHQTNIPELCETCSGTPKHHALGDKPLHSMKYQKKTVHTKPNVIGLYTYICLYIYTYIIVYIPIYTYIYLYIPSNHPRPATRSCQAMADPFGRARDAVQGWVKRLHSPKIIDFIHEMIDFILEIVDLGHKTTCESRRTIADLRMN